MDYKLADSSGTDDDLPPSHDDRIPRGSRVAGNGQSVIGSVPYPRMHNVMESQIHQLEQEAYGSVLRAFKAQSDALTWEKEGLITELRKELRVSDDEHRELLTRVNADDLIHRIRAWREAGRHEIGMFSTLQPLHDVIPSPMVSTYRKRQKTSQSVSVPFGVQSQSLNPQPVAAFMQPSSSAVRWGTALGAGSKKPKPDQPLPGLSSMQSTQYPSTGDSGRGQLANFAVSTTGLTKEPAEVITCDPLIGRKVMTRWPKDNSFYEAIIKDYNPVEGLHALVYDIHMPNETWEWVDLKEIPPEDIRWEDECSGICHHGGNGVKTSMSCGAVLGARSGKLCTIDQLKNEFTQSEIGVAKKASQEVEILHTETLIKEIERVFNANHTDLLEIGKAKKMLKEHEQALIDVIAKLGDASDSESDEEQQPSSRGQLMMDIEQG